MLEAALRTTVGEDRTTEVLACCLADDSDARRAFCEIVGAPALEDAELVTQRRVTSADRIDCELRLSSGSDLHVVWIEVKVGTATEQPRQLERYALQLRRLYPGHSTLVALAPAADDIMSSAIKPLTDEDGTVVADRKAKPLTWDDLARTLDCVGRARDNLTRRWWRRAARSDDALARQRNLADALDYLEREGLVDPNDPITSSDAHVAYRAQPLLDAITRLLDLTATRIEEFGGREVKRYAGAWGDVRNVAWTGGWPAELNAGGETLTQLGLMRTDDVARADEPRYEPTFFVGIAFEPATLDAAEALTNPAWETPEELRLYRWNPRNPRLIVVRKLLYFSELALQGVTLSQQAEALAAWASTGFEGLRALTDPRLVLAQPLNKEPS